ncbi:hypothetical protein AX16_005400 [Volvariella volvacea WC 439]|nr:hypothetical protein AX16_005400 [Volvariella volvacea WC 439]
MASSCTQVNQVSTEGRVSRGRRRIRSLVQSSKYLLRFIAPLAASSLFLWSKTSLQDDARNLIVSRPVIVQMFEWNWDSIADECTNFLGPAGYGYIQGKHYSSCDVDCPSTRKEQIVSPPQEHVKGPQWWTDYQPVSYKLDSKHGNRAQFVNMINTCHAAGVRVIVDTIWNHMASTRSGVGTAGSSFTHYEYPGLYKYQDFHHCGLTPGDLIMSYYNRLEVQTCELENLADLATETEYVRSRLAEYTNDLLSLGVDGLRLDAAKHMAVEDIASIISRLSRTTYITQEVTFGHGEPIQPSEYVGIGDVQEFRYTNALKDAFLRDGIANLRMLNNEDWIPSDRANVFVTNHDTERNGHSLNARSPSNTYITSHIFSLAHPYGTPTILSSYSFSDRSEGAPNGGYGTCSATGGKGGWLCQHRYTAISGMVAFRNQVGSAAITNWVSPEPQRIAFGRGAAGYVAINNADQPWIATFSTSLPDGQYCDVISGVTTSSGFCTGAGVTVEGGVFTAAVAARGALAIHTGARGIGNTVMIAVTFSVTAETFWGENIFIVGSIPQLGKWKDDEAIALLPDSYPTWIAMTFLPAGTEFQYKYIRKRPDGTVVWESGSNRDAFIPSTGTLTLSSTWK